MDKDEKYRQYILIFILLGLCYVFYNIFFRDNSELDNLRSNYPDWDWDYWDALLEGYGC